MTYLEWMITMKTREFILPDYITKEDLKRVRKKLHLTQKEFARFIKVSKSTVERWESSDEKITGPIVVLIKMLEEHPQYMESMKTPQKTMPLRLWYMYKEKVCTLIDVNEVKREVEIINYTDNIMYRAFGIVEAPNFEMYQEFLESRCFPRTRDKMKLILKDLDIPFYDPLLIIEKTEGRMAEDDFWIQIER